MKFVVHLIGHYNGDRVRFPEADINTNDILGAANSHQAGQFFFNSSGMRCRHQVLDRKLLFQIAFVIFQSCELKVPEPIFLDTSKIWPICGIVDVRLLLLLVPSPCV